MISLVVKPVSAIMRVREHDGEFRTARGCCKSMGEVGMCAEGELDSEVDLPHIRLTR